MLAYGDAGKLWSSSLQRQLLISPNNQTLQAARGQGISVSFNIPPGGSTPWTPPADALDSLSVPSGGGYLYRDQADLALERYSSAGALSQRTSASGMTLAATTSTSGAAPATVTTTTYSDPFGRTLVLISKPLNSQTAGVADVGISTITDATGRQITATYDNASASATTGNLTSLTWQDGNSQSFIYDSPNAGQSWALTGITDENGKRYATIGYDPAGWAKSTQLAGAVDSYTISYGSGNTGAPVPTITEQLWPNDTSPTMVLRYHEWQAPSGTQILQPNGTTSLGMNATTALVRDPTNSPNLGSPRAAGMSQPAGAGCGASTSNLAYDANGNITQEDDFNGHRTCYAYSTNTPGSINPVPNLETTRIEGLSNTVNCASTLPAGSRKISTTWHPNWRLKESEAQPLKITYWIYNGRPDPFNSGTVANCASVTAGYGTGPAANFTTTTLANGSTTPALPDGSPIAVLCKKVEVATTDTDGHLGLSATVDTTVPNRIWTYTYNQYGQKLTQTDAAGHTTSYAYYSDTSFTGADPNAVGHTMGDLKTVTPAIAALATNYTAYDKAGRLLAMTDANGTITSYCYSPRGWLTRVKQGGGQTNCQGAPESDGQVTSYDYWPTGLLKKVTQPDGSYLYYQYDDAHRLTDVSDQVDSTGKLTGNTVHYTLDAMGNRTGEVDHDSSGTLTRNITRNYDALNRLQNVTGAVQ